MTWLVNFPDWPMTSPNEAAVTLLPIWALLSALPEGARRPWHAALRFGLLVVLIMTQSRSGLVAWSLYLMMSVNWGRWRTLAITLVLLAGAALFVPATYWERLAHTASLRGGSFDAYSSIMRFYSWQSALKSFAHHPILGVGYLGFRFISADYNDLHAFVGTESYYFEIAAGMGIIGLVLLARAIAALFRLGSTVLRNTPSGTFGHRLAQRHAPLIVALLAANITGDNFVGMVGLGQLAIWCAILVRSGHLEVRSPEPS